MMDAAAGCAQRTHQNGRFTSIIGTPVSITSIDGVLNTLRAWMTDRRDRFVVVRDVHGVVRAREDIRLKHSHDQADLTVPDGMPLVWVARLSGAKGISRVCGPELLPAVCQHGIPFGWRHYFLGGAPGIAEAASRNLASTYPGLRIAGFYCPPFRSMSEDEDERMCADIRASGADFLWVGLGTPKQEIWMHQHRGRCGGVTMLGVGAAFDVAAGAMRRAPVFMQKYGLEWLFRLVNEPRRLWRRYLVLAPKFIWLTSCELIKNRIKAFVVRPISAD